MNKLRQIFLVILLGLSTAASANKEIIRIPLSLNMTAAYGNR